MSFKIRIPSHFHASMLPLIGTLLFFACSSGTRCPSTCKEGRAGKPEVTNPYGTIHGDSAVEKMTLEQLRTEKAGLETRLAKNPLDTALLRILNSPGYETFDSEYDSLSSHANDYYATGKLRRYPRSELQRRNIAASIRDSRDKIIFDRYREVRLRILSGHYYTAPVTPPPAPVSTPVSVSEKPSPSADSLSKAPASAGDSLWSGVYRSTGGAGKAASEKFITAESCAEWAMKKADGFRENSYSFSYECVRGGESVKRKLW
jgi:hypothetical protein